MRLAPRPFGRRPTGTRGPTERLTVTSFHDLGLDPLLLKALDTEGYTTPTPIQAQAIPSVLEGKDLLGIAQTGTGKTAAFALPILQRLNANRQPALRKGVRALVLSPTRELATQIAESFRTYGRHMGMSVAVVYGGVAHKPQRDALARGVDVLVATPGRLIDHMTEHNVVLEGTEILVLDEADQMMDLGFIRPLRQIVAKLSHRRQSLFFSATMPHEIGALAAELLKDPVKVSVTPQAKTADRVAQEVIFIEQQKKRSLLVELFANPDLSRTIVFTRTKRGADRVARHLEGAGIPVAAIHGNKSQVQRDHAMRGFKAGKIRALIATDIAARGIDVDAVSHVINYEIPNVPESYVHRIGRTARAGAEGIAISLVDHEEMPYLRDIERLTRLKIPAKDRRNDATLVAPKESRAERDAERADLSPGGSRGHRGSRNDRPSHTASRGGEHRDRGAEKRDGHSSRPQRPRFENRDARGEQSVRGQERPAFDPLKKERPAAAEAGSRRHEGRSDQQRGGDQRRGQHRDHRSGRRQDERRGDRAERAGEDRSVKHYGDRTAEARPQGERSFGERGRGAESSRGGERNHRDHGTRDGERRSHGAESRPRHNSPRDGEHRAGGDRAANGHGRSGHHGQRGDGASKGLEGVKFLSNRGDRPRGRSSAPQGDDRRKAPRNA